MPAEPDELILEGIVVTQDAAASANIAPMGPRVDREQTRLVLRPFQTAQTFRNLQATRCGVFHVTDDVELLARAAVGQLDPPSALVPVDGFSCLRLADCCRWLAFRVNAIDDQSERTTIDCQVIAKGTLREFFGFNRAKHAVVEAAILATRIGIVPDAELWAEMARLQSPVAKTAGEQERRAFEFLRQYVESRLGPSFPDSD
ncbi:MAG TPA: DUF447 domain-containing protein [Pirellulaceae bacterium]|nr:DUF447 domain-containing protein [Pirellulaceae bacterium]